MAAPPPSKPDRRISRIRLSSRWVLCRGGTALRLVPKSVGQTFGITQANSTRLIPPPVSPRGHSRWFAFPSFCPSHFHLPASLCSTVVTRFFATTDALTPAGRFFGHCCHELRLAPAGLPDFGTGTADHSVSNHRCHDRDRPVARRFGSRLSPALQASSFARRLAHPHRPNRVHGGCPSGQPVLRTGRSRSVALHPALLRRSYGSIPHGSSPHRSGLPPLYPTALSGARAEPTWLPRSSGCIYRRTTGSPGPSACPRPRTKCWAGPSSCCWSPFTRRRSTASRMGFGLDARPIKRWKPFGNRPARGSALGAGSGHPEVF